MAKTYVGSRLRQLRRERDLSQASLAEALGLSASYVNQIEHDVRPLTVPVLMRITDTFGVDATFFSQDDESRLLAEIQDVIRDREVISSTHSGFDVHELSEVVYNHPEISRILVDIHRRYRLVRDKLSLATDTRNVSPGQQALSMPHDEARDFFYTHQNYFNELDHWAEKLATELGVSAFGIAATEAALRNRLETLHNITLTSTKDPDVLHHLNRHTGELELATTLTTGQRAFRMATEIAHLEATSLIDALVVTEPFTSSASRNLTRRGLASYAAAAIILPYSLFHSTAEQHGYDVEYLCTVFGVGYETIASRLSTLQRPNLRGVPFTFVRVDRAGNMSKRQSANGIHFTNSGGTCPLWAVYDTFANPGSIVRQHAQMPDGRDYLWIARTVRHHHGRFSDTEKIFSIGLGCEVRDAQRTVYAQGMDLKDPSAATHIGAGCRVCPRQKCPQRAFPAIQVNLEIDTHRSTIAPY